MDFKFELLPPEIRLVIDTEKGEQYIEASAEQLLAELHHARQAELLEEVARVYCGENGQGCLAERMLAIIEHNMTQAPAESFIKDLKARYHL